MPTKSINNPYLCTLKPYNIMRFAFRQALSTLLVLTLIMFMASCSDNDYTKAIPQNANMVTRIDFASIISEADFRNTTANGAINLYTGMIMGGKDSKMVREYLDKPEKLGIDLRKPAYLFKTTEFVGVTLDLHNEDKLTEFLDLLSKHKLVSKVREEGKISSCTIMGEILVAFDKNSMILLTSIDGGSMSNLRLAASSLLQQNEEASFASSEYFERLEDEGKDKDLACYMNMASAPESATELVDALTPDGVRPADVCLFGIADFTDGKATFTASIYGKTEKAEQALAETNKSFRRIRNDYINVPTDNLGVWATMGVEGQWLLDRLKSSKTIKPMLIALGRAIDIDMMLRSVDGDFTVTLPADVELDTQTVPEFLIMSNVKDTKFMADVDYWQKSMKEYGATMRKTNDSQYQLTYQQTVLDWGLEGNTLFIATHRQFMNNGTMQHTGILQPLKDEIAQQQLFAYFNLEKMPLKSLRAVPLFGGNVHKMKSLIIKSSSANNLTIEVELKDKSQNFLKSMI